MRADLLALSPDDLATMANRGLVKRAQREVEASDLTAEWEEKADGTIRAKWSDQVTSVIPGGKALRESTCTCGSFEMCRHVLRTVLVWQIRQKSLAVDEGGQEVAESAPLAWDPGIISDDVILAQVPKAVRERADLLWTQGILAELLGSAKPTAQFHFPGHTVRLLVPGDLRYANCSCPDAAPCVHAVLAVRAFRLLDAEKTTGIVSRGTLVSPVNDAPLRAAEQAITDLFQMGFSSINTAWRDRLRRIAEECHGSGLIWPSDILEEVAADFDKYDSRDSSFDPMETLKRLGEFLLRSDAIISGKGPVPQPFIRGMKGDREAEMGTLRLMGLGADIEEGRSSSTVTVYMQNTDSGHAMTISREFNEDVSKASAATNRNAPVTKPASPPGSAAPVIVRKPYRELARGSAVKSANLMQLAAGQLISQGGKRTAAGKLIIGRARAAVNPQNYQWERLKAPVLVEDFHELHERLRNLPPASFRARRVGADFHVCPVVAIEEPAFNAMTNCVQAVLMDNAGGNALLIHPWSDRGSSGADALLNGLRGEDKPLFVAGHFRLAGSCLIAHPTALVLSGKQGRRILLPWLDSAGTSESTSLSPTTQIIQRTSNSRYHFADELMSRLLLNGLNRSKNEGWPTHAATALELEQRGYHQLATILKKLPNSKNPASLCLTILKLLALARDLG